TKTTLKKLNCTLPSLPARGQRAASGDCGDDGERARLKTCDPDQPMCIRDLIQALRAWIIGVGRRDERALRRARTRRRSVVPKTSNSPPRLSVAGPAAVNGQRKQEFLARWATF